MAFEPRRAARGGIQVALSTLDVTIENRTSSAVVANSGSGGNCGNSGSSSNGGGGGGCHIRTED